MQYRPYIALYSYREDVKWVKAEVIFMAKIKKRNQEKASEKALPYIRIKQRITINNYII